MSVRVRFAPSPTGYLHIGGARTALFNWLLARHSGGTFILRIEDTDVERSSSEMVEGILEGMRWLELDWDDGPYFQSKRLHNYRDACQQLLEKGLAYRDFSKVGAEASDYRHFRELAESQASRRAASGEPHAVRFKVEAGEQICFSDEVFGPVQVGSEEVPDFVIVRSDGHPTYHLSVVVDDIDMGITHVVRGADHLSNTSKHVLLFQALGQPVPKFAHLPLILGPDKKRLSKRHGALSVLEYRQQGYLPAAMLNYLALLGWSPGDDREILNKEELIELFKLSRVNKADAVFDVQKLEWINGPCISSLSGQQLEAEVRVFLEAASLWNPAWETDLKMELWKRLNLLKTRVRRLVDFAVQWRAFFTEDFEYAPDAVQRFLSPPEKQTSSLRAAVIQLRDSYQSLDPFDLGETERVLREVAEHSELKAGTLIGAVRVAMTGQAVAPGVFDVLVTLGRDTTVLRLNRLLDFLS